MKKDGCFKMVYVEALMLSQAFKHYLDAKQPLINTPTVCMPVIFEIRKPLKK